MFSILKKMFLELLAVPKNLLVFLKNKNLELSTLWLFIRHPNIIKEIIFAFDAKFQIVDKKLTMIFEKPKVKFWVNNISDIALINGVFSTKGDSYKFALPRWGGGAFSKCVVIDIGMNIGDTPLFFAGLDCVEHIYGFEPFKKTFDQAQFNFNLNKDLGKKITAYNFGLSDKDKILDTVFCQDFTISNTTVLDQKLDKWTKSVMESSADIKEKVVLKSAAEEISKIISGTKNKVVIKMDCEGEEYAIFEALNKAKTFKNIDAIMLEYHRKGRESILDILNEHGFISFLRETDLLNGMIYAVRVEESNG